MISLRNVAKLLKDHPEIPQPEEILAQAKALSNKGILSGMALDVLFPGRSSDLVREIETDEEHIRMGMEDIRKAGQ